MVFRGWGCTTLAKVLARIEFHQVRMRSGIEQLCADSDPLAMTSDGLYSRATAATALFTDC